MSVKTLVSFLGTKFSVLWSHVGSRNVAKLDAELQHSVSEPSYRGTQRSNSVSHTQQIIYCYEVCFRT
jgi:hypothetical protein